jgi:hypothetical protein
MKHIDYLLAITIFLAAYSFVAAQDDFRHIKGDSNDAASLSTSNPQPDELQRMYPRLRTYVSQTAHVCIPDGTRM